MFDTSPLKRNWRDPETRELAKLLDDLLSQTSFELLQPINLLNFGSGPAIAVKQMSNGITAIEQTNQEGQLASVGFGMASRGLVANELVPDPNFAIDPNIVREQLSTQGNDPASRAETDGFNTGVSGSGVPNTLTPMVPTADWGRALTSLQKSNDTEHAPDSADKFTRDGQVSWLVRKPSHWQVLRATVTAINDDTLTCSVVPHGKVVAETITVAKPCTLQMTPWDGVTVDGITYTYTDSQHREADEGGYAPEEQVVDPPYVLDGPCPEIYVHWVANDVDVTVADGGQWIDLNVDARHWEPV